MFQHGSGSVSLNWRSAGSLTRSRRSIRLRTSSLVIGNSDRGVRFFHSLVWKVRRPTGDACKAVYVQNEYLIIIDARFAIWGWFMSPAGKARMPKFLVSAPVRFEHIA